MARKRIKRTDHELIQVSDHLLYELQMLFGTARTMARTQWPEENNEGSWSIRNALIESFTVHVRIVLDFLYSEDPQEDDVVADDFFDNPEQWRSRRPKRTELLTTVHRRVGKDVAHLTYARIGITQEAKQWRFVQIADDIGSVVEKFVSIVPQNRLSQRFASIIQKLSHEATG